MPMTHALTISIFSRFAKFLLGISSALLTTTSVSAGYTESSHCRDLVKQALKTPLATSRPSASQCPVSALVVKWLQLQQEASPTEAAQFLKKHPTWPRLATIRLRAESALARDGSRSDVLKWFSDFPALSAEGFAAHIAALVAAGKMDQAKEVIQTTFKPVEFTSSSLTAFIQKHRSLISEATLYGKANFHLDKNEAGLGEALIPFLNREHQDTIRTRIKLLNNQDEEIKTAAEPHVLFEQVRYYRRNQQTDKAVDLLKKLDEMDSAIDKEIIWAERNILGRRLIEQKRYEGAYNLYKNHRLKSGENFANGEWLAGWLALRFMEKPDKAIDHFNHLQQNVKAPISMARACYWLGRAHKQQDDHEQAKTWFTKARHFPTTYYGQLAIKELHGKIQGLKPQRLAISEKMRKQFETRPMVKAIHLLHSVGNYSFAESLGLALALDLKAPEEQLLLIDLAHEKAGPSAAVHTAKKATKTHDHFVDTAFPRVNLHHVKHHVEPAMAHAIIRQESRFKHDAVSSAGAIGLMQLMPATAKMTIKKHKLKQGKLTDPKSNTTVGCHHLKDLLSRYDRSLILAAAAYNAGGQAVDAWLEQFGDPRDPKMDSIDWVEQIPYAETRNYVQRVVENYHCYRSLE